MIKLEDAYFGIMLPNFNKKGKLGPANLFNSMRVLWSVALWKTKPDVRENRDLIEWCFCDTRGRCEYDWVVSPWVGGGEDVEGQKVDVYHMYVEPSRKILAEIVNNISVSSCRKWLRDCKR